MITKNCEYCGKEFEYEPPAGYPDKRKYCNFCAKVKKEQYNANQQPPAAAAPSVQAGPGNGVIAATKGIEKVEHIFQSSYEFGPAGNRHTIKYFSILELKEKKKELIDAGLMDVI